MKELMQAEDYMHEALEGEFSEYDRELPSADDLLEARTRKCGVVFDEEGVPTDADDDDSDDDTDDEEDQDADDSDEDED